MPPSRCIQCNHCLIDIICFQFEIPRLIYLYFTVIYPIAIDILTRHLLFAFQSVLFKYIILYAKWRGKFSFQWSARHFPIVIMGFDQKVQLSDLNPQQVNERNKDCNSFCCPSSYFVQTIYTKIHFDSAKIENEMSQFPYGIS